jgi:hypothetical protein
MMSNLEGLTVKYTTMSWKINLRAARKFQINKQSLTPGLVLQDMKHIL